MTVGGTGVGESVGIGDGVCVWVGAGVSVGEIVGLGESVGVAVVVVHANAAMPSESAISNAVIKVVNL